MRLLLQFPSLRRGAVKYNVPLPILHAAKTLVNLSLVPKIPQIDFSKNYSLGETLGASYIQRNFFNAISNPKIFQ